MALGAFRYVWPAAGLLRVRLLACFGLVMVERGINLAVPILFKQMVESLSQTGPVSTAAEALLNAAGWVRAPAAAPGPAAAQGGGGGGGGLPFWAAFYPWAFYYLGTLFLRGGAGGEGLLADVRDILWIPITQVGMEPLGLLLRPRPYHSRGVSRAPAMPIALYGCR
jgi:ATP-binding cassette subfamily B (MDR/TAP) protein 6